VDFLGRHRPHQGRRRIGNHGRRPGRNIYPHGRFHRPGTLPDRLDRRACAYIRQGTDRPGLVEPAHRRGLRRAAHARAHGQPRHGLLPPRPRRRRRAPGAGRGYLRHGGRHPVPLRRHVPRPPGHRAGDPGCLRRPHHGHLRQEFANRALQRQAGCCGRLPVGKFRPFGARGDGERREIPRQLGAGAENRVLPRPARKPGAGQTLLEGAHGAQHLLLHGGLLGLCHGRWRREGLLGGLFGTRRRAGHGKHETQLRPAGQLYGNGRRCRGVPQGHRRQIRPDHPRPAGLRQAPQGAG